MAMPVPALQHCKAGTGMESPRKKKKEETKKDVAPRSGSRGQEHGVKHGDSRKDSPKTGLPVASISTGVTGSSRRKQVKTIRT